jgi:kynurenine formamidase
MKMTLAEAVGGYEVVDLTHIMEEGMPRPQVPYGHVPWKSERARGARDEVPPDRCMGPISCLDMRQKKEREFVMKCDLEEGEKRHGAIERGDVVLLNIGWEHNWRVPSGVDVQPYVHNNPGLHEEAAKYLAERGAKLVGGDIPSIDSDARADEPAHKVFLPKGILIL